MLQYYLISPNFEHRNVVNTVNLVTSIKVLYMFAIMVTAMWKALALTWPHLGLGIQRKQGLICFPLYGFHSEHSSARSPSAQLVSTPARDTPLEVELHWPEHASREQHVAQSND